jgi:DNA-binding NarL/FixJ family response regulator
MRSHNQDHPRPNGPIAVTARPFARKHADLARQLKEQDFELRFVRDWHQLLTGPHAAPDVTPDVVLVDYDAAGHSDDGARTPLSAHRLVTLLARHFSGQPTALILHTELDFAEVEDLALAGVDAFISSKHGASVCADQITAALARRRARLRQRRSGPSNRASAAGHAPAPTPQRTGHTGDERSCATVPVLTSDVSDVPGADLAFAHALPTMLPPSLS